jgi:hypothetical protein
MTPDLDLSFLADLPWEESVVPHLPLRLRPARFRMAPPVFHLPEPTTEEIETLLRALGLEH